MAVIDQSASVPPLLVDRQADGGITISRNDACIQISGQELDEVIRIARPAMTPAKLMRYRMG